MKNETLFFHQDNLMSTLALTDNQGSVKESYSYDPYGNLLTPPSVSSTRFLYTGRELDPETNLYYNRARYYNPSLGRFLSPDPKGYEAGLNLYTYTRDNPLSFRDPEGLDVYWGGGGERGKGGGLKGFFGVLLGIAVGFVLGPVIGAVAGAIGGAIGGAVGGVVGAVGGAIAGAAGSAIGTAVGAAVGAIATTAAVAAGTAVVATAASNIVQGAPVFRGVGMSASIAAITAGALKIVGSIGAGIQKWAVGGDPRSGFNYFGTDAGTTQEIVARRGGRIYINGANTSFHDAILQARAEGATLFYNPSRGLIADSTELLLQKITGTSAIGREFGRVLGQASDSVSIIARSQGALVASNGFLANALDGQSVVSGSRLTLLGGAGNPLITQAIAKLDGVSIFESQTNYFDPVAVLQLNPNPVKIVTGAVGGLVTLGAYHSCEYYDCA